MDPDVRPGITPNTSGGFIVNDQPAASRTVEVDADVYDVLERTANRRDTDINGALRYLIEAPKVATVPQATEDE
ncbi:hypothetical protein [Micromonospora sp. CNB394]|uniref:hypothetical protein n=1 Tax=Micromonospora sp. CNB394 TaxID=1169151 RepID=UPI0012DF6A92|nr:hypothetical protein [Micromonospora sp. CNB394]